MRLVLQVVSVARLETQKSLVRCCRTIHQSRVGDHACLNDAFVLGKFQALFLNLMPKFQSSKLDDSQASFSKASLRMAFGSTEVTIDIECLAGARDHV